MDVWLVETGCYEQRGVSGIYASLDAALAANPIPDGLSSHFVATAAGPGWVERSDGEWDNGLDWDYAATITRTPVKS